MIVPGEFPHAVVPEAWPRLPLGEWLESYETLHRWVQVIGKTRLALAPMQNHWWQVPLYVTARGIGTSPMPRGAHDIDLELDFIDHVLVARTSSGAMRTMRLEARTVADFYFEYQSMLRSLGVEVAIWPVPVELADTLPFPADAMHASYDPGAVYRWWRILAQTDRVLKTFRAGFLGKSSPSHLWWGGFDLACTRFSGRRAPRHPGGIRNLADRVTVEAYSHECMSVGWWPGTADGPVSEAAFYAYAYPEPHGYDKVTTLPVGARYHAGLREWILPYDMVRDAANPEALLLEFFESAYRAAADLGGWDRCELEPSWAHARRAATW